jgi:glutamine synthetase
MYFSIIGSSQNVSLVNTVLATIVAKAFQEFSNEIEINHKTPKEVAQEALKTCWNTIFNGNGYDSENQKMLTERGNWRFDSGVDAILRYTQEKNLELFQTMKVLSKDECNSRQSVMLSQYINTVEMEVLCLIDMLQQNILPSIHNTMLMNKDFDTIYLTKVNVSLKLLQVALDDMVNNSENDIVKAKKARVLRLETMIEIRKICDEVEGLIPANLWNIATYKELLFIDLHVK